MASDNAEIERSTRELCEQGRVGEAVTAVLRGYGPEILGLLRALSKNEDDAGDAFGAFAEDLMRGLGSFAWRSSVRTWSYTLARHALLRAQTSPHRRAGRQVPLSQSPVSLLAEQVREQTMPHLRTEVKDGLARLREGLAPEEQLLLTLRVDQQMSWDEITAIADAGQDEATTKDSKKRAALYRKRFQLLKDKLRKQAAAVGLLGDDPSEALNRGYLADWSSCKRTRIRARCCVRWGSRVQL